MLGEIRKGRSESCRVVFGGDAIRHVVGTDVDARPSLDRGDLPGHGHRAGEGRVVGHEIHFLDDARIRNEVDESSLDDVGLSRGLPAGASSVGVRQDQPVGASGAKIESLEPAGHALRRQPILERFPIDECCVDRRSISGDDPRRSIGARHSRNARDGTSRR
jgi:hypothetical protein